MKKMIAILAVLSVLLVPAAALPQNFIPFQSSSFDGATMENILWQPYNCGAALVTEDNNKFLRAIGYGENSLKNDSSPLLDLAPYLDGSKVRISVNVRLVPDTQKPATARLVFGVYLCSGSFSPAQPMLFWDTTIPVGEWITVTMSPLEISAQEYEHAYFALVEISPSEGLGEGGSLQNIRYLDMDEFCLYRFGEAGLVDNGITASPAPTKPPTAPPENTQLPEETALPTEISTEEPVTASPPADATEIPATDAPATVPTSVPIDKDDTERASDKRLLWVFAVPVLAAAVMVYDLLRRRNKKAPKEEQKQEEERK